MNDLTRILILCTRNSARSQMAEALLARDGGSRVHVASAGSDPGDSVHPLAIESLREVGIAWDGRRSQGMTDVQHLPWDLVITVCDAARDACPIPPAGAVAAHWGIEDPAAATGSHADQLAAFGVARDRLHSRITAFLALPFEHLRDADSGETDRARDQLVNEIQAIGEQRD
jgi:arsenate reductase (thioredoxin)